MNNVISYLQILSIQCHTKSLFLLISLSRSGSLQIYCKKKQMYSPVKHYQYSMNASTSIISVTSDLQIGSSLNSITKDTIKKSNSVKRHFLKSKGANILTSLLKKRIYWAFQRVRRKTLKTEISVGNQNQDCYLKFEEGLIELDHFMKCQYQNNKVMAFTFINNFYKEHKKRQQKRLKTAGILLNNLLNRKQKINKQHGMNQIVKYAVSRPRQDYYKLAFKSLSNILGNDGLKKKKYAFQNILRQALQKVKTQQQPQAPNLGSQHIYLINSGRQSRHFGRRRSSQAFSIKVPIMSQRIYLQQYNIINRKKHRISSLSVKEQTKITYCKYCTYSKRCKYCDILKVLNF